MPLPSPTRKHVCARTEDGSPFGLRGPRPRSPDLVQRLAGFAAGKGGLVCAGEAWLTNVLLISGGLLDFHTENTWLRSHEALCFATAVCGPEGAEPPQSQNGGGPSSFAATKATPMCKAAESQHRNIYQNILLHRTDSF